MIINNLYNDKWFNETNLRIENLLKNKKVNENKFVPQEIRNFIHEIKRLNNIIFSLETFLIQEKYRLAIETSNIYEDSLGKTRFVNEDIYNEITQIQYTLRFLDGDDNNESK